MQTITQIVQEIPHSSINKGKQIFCERYVKMRGQNYYMRVFSDGSSEFVRYDEQAKKWVLLCFPAEKRQENVAASC